MWDRHSLTLTTWIITVFAIVGGVLLLIGYLTPVAATIASFDSLALSLISQSGFSQAGPLNLIAFQIAIPIALAFLGPGAFSLDARLFGHREIIIPRPLNRD